MKDMTPLELASQENLLPETVMLFHWLNGLDLPERSIWELNCALAITLLRGRQEIGR